MFQSAPVSPNLDFGVIVTGLRMRDLDDEAIRARLRELWIKEGVIVFRDMVDDPGEVEDAQIALSLCFGPLAEHPLKTFEASKPALAVLKITPEHGHVCEVEGKLRGGWLPWHSDLVYMDKVNRGGILAPVQLPRSGGQTGFIDQISAYQRVPDELKARIEDLYVEYKLDLDVGRQRFGKRPGAKLAREGGQFAKIMARVDDYPSVLHPMVYSQAETGKKVLNVSPWFALGIDGMEKEEGDKLLSEIVDICVDADNAYFHEWMPNDLVLWDNWRMLHCAEGIDPSETRIMKRTTIEGDYALGRLKEPASVAARVSVDV